jgi:uncharacterized protein YlzI (FlbEa/FlbD family)
MKLLKLSLNVHENITTGKEIVINPEYIVSIREWIYTSGNYSEISMINGDKINVNETVKQIDKMMGKTKWL